MLKVASQLKQIRDGSDETANDENARENNRQFVMTDKTWSRNQQGVIGIIYLNNTTFLEDSLDRSYLQPASTEQHEDGQPCDDLDSPKYWSQWALS